MLVCSSGRDKLDIEVLEVIEVGGERMADCFVHVSIQGFTGSAESTFPVRSIQLFCDTIHKFAGGIDNSVELNSETPCKCSLCAESHGANGVLLSISLSRPHPGQPGASDSHLSGAFVISPDRLAIAAERFGNLASRVE